MTAGRKYSLRFTIASLVVVLLLATVEMLRRRSERMRGLSPG